MRTATLLGVLAFAVGMFVPDLVGSEDLAKGQAAFQKYSAACHGPAGKGDGPPGARIRPKLKDLADKTYNAAMKDDYLVTIILEGVEGGGQVAHDAQARRRPEGRRRGEPHRLHPVPGKVGSERAGQPMRGAKTPALT